MKYSVKFEDWSQADSLYVASAPAGFFISRQPHDAHPFETRQEAADALFRKDGLGLADILAQASDAITIYPTELQTKR